MPNPELNHPLHEHEAVWGNTVRRTEALRESRSRDYEEPDHATILGKQIEGKPAKYGWYKGRHVIGRDETVNGGVYIGGGSREEIVVDDTKNIEQYEKVYQKLWDKIRARQAEGVTFKEGLLDDVYETALETLQFDDDYADAVADEFTDKKVPLAGFIDAGKGVCRHQALLTAYLLERLGREGYVAGKASVDRNVVPGLGGHAWARYTNSSGEVYILDPAQEFRGLLRDAPKDGWKYERPDENLAA